MKPFFCYFGGKWRIARHYPAPQFDRVFEPFAGAAGYSTWYAPKRVVLADADPVLCRTWEWLIQSTSEQVRALPLIGGDQDVQSLELPEGAKSLIGFWLNKGCSRPMRTPSAWMRSGTRPNSYWGIAIRDRIAGQVPEITGWKICNQPYWEWPDIEATWFIDPPYFGKPGENYRCGSKAIDYKHLAEWCRTRRGQVIVCEGPGASWLPFRELGSFKANPSRRGKGFTKEFVWP